MRNGRLSEALGVNIQQSPERCLELLDEVGNVFFFAQKYHTSMKHVGAIRRSWDSVQCSTSSASYQSGTPSMQLLGVYDEYLVEPLAQVLIQLGIRRGMVVYMGRISWTKSPHERTNHEICEIRDGWFKSVITPEDFGFERCTKEDLRWCA